MVDVTAVKKANKTKERRSRQNRANCVVMLEVESLKNIIENHGPGGQNLIVHWVSSNAKSRLRSTEDTLSYLGDGQFLLILKSISLRNADKVCRRLSEELQAAEGGNIFGQINYRFGIAKLRPNETLHSARTYATEGLAKAIERDQLVIRVNTNPLYQLIS